MSTPDLYGDSFVLLAGDGGDGWLRATRLAAAERRIPLGGYRIGTDGDLVDLSGRWATVYGTGPDGASLVRPDGHVA
jgi:putative polyketide hydroxylase